MKIQLYHRSVIFTVTHRLDSYGREHLGTLSLSLSPRSFLSAAATLLQSFLATHSSTACASESHCQCFAHSFLFSSHLLIGVESSSNSSSTCKTVSLHAAGFVILRKKPAPPTALDIIRPTSFWCFFSRPSVIWAQVISTRKCR